MAVPIVDLFEVIRSIQISPSGYSMRRARTSSTSSL
jgi:hypothetical protein